MSQLIVRSMTQRWRPSRVDDSMPLRASLATLRRGARAAGGVVVCLVAVQLVRPVAGSAAAGTDRGQGVEQGYQDIRVDGVGGRDQGGQRQSGPLRECVDLAARLAAIDWVWPGQVPFFSA